MTLIFQAHVAMVNEPYYFATFSDFIVTTALPLTSLTHSHIPL